VLGRGRTGGFGSLLVTVGDRMSSRLVVTEVAVSGMSILSGW
jgi:hypothetical protein